MANKQDIRYWLVENGYTHEDIDRFWSLCVKYNDVCSQYAKEGKSWTDLKMGEIYEIPNLRNEILAHRRELREQRYAESKEWQGRCKYYIEHFEEIAFKKIKEGKKLTREELCKLTEYSIKRTYGENRKWQRTVTDVCRLCGSFFLLSWEEGLTDRQCNDYDVQPVEVFPHRSIKIIEEVTYDSNPDNYFVLEEYYKSKDIEFALNLIKDELSNRTGKIIKVLTTKEEIIVSKQ